MTFRIGVIGAGRMGRTHIKALGSSELVEVAGVVEPFAATREAVAASGLPAFETLAELLAATSIDGALVVVPTDQHVAVLAEVMAADLPVMCEKPCGLTAEQAAQNAALAQRTGLPLQVAYWRRFVPDLVALRHRLLGGELGEILAVNCFQWDEAPPSAAFRTSSGGIYADMGVHEFDQIRWLTGQDFSVVHAAKSVPGTVDGDPECAQLACELDGGSTAVVSLGRWHPPGDMVKVEVYGTKGAAGSVFLDPADGNVVFHEALRLQAEDFACLVRTGEGSGARAADAVAALQVAEMAVSQTAKEL
ncbi:MAG TPA: Gfo/Idh/MocA family oxidoreductase [Streptosporangiaceae bacterium]|nr:Gfo/Idh/MocA family oxidoreductase [Streptosporangiaceae bacterium]